MGPEPFRPDCPEFVPQTWKQEEIFGDPEGRADKQSAPMPEWENELLAPKTAGPDKLLEEEPFIPYSSQQTEPEN